VETSFRDKKDVRKAEVLKEGELLDHLSFKNNFMLIPNNLMGRLLFEFELNLSELKVFIPI
jgi:hypothetical protein